ncbi:MAG: hypothetical protein PVF33_08595, partial [Candidatus Latescibacterota bacterium]
MSIKNRILKMVFLALVSLGFVIACSDDAVQTPETPQKFGANDLFVSGSSGSDVNDGSLGAPFKTIQRAIDAAEGAGGGTVNVAAGTYAENIELSSGVNLLGGYEDGTFDRDIAANETIIEGDGRATISAKGVSDVTVEGFTVSNADVGIGDARTSSLAIHLHDCVDVEISSNVVRSGSVLNTGAGGAAGSDGPDGTTGHPGFTTGNGGTGGVAPNILYPIGTPRFATGGRGGAGKTESTGDTGDAGGDGFGGAGGAGATGPNSAGKNGSAGGKGTNGSGGDNGLAFGGADSTGYLSGDGEDGQNGRLGLGGGGGGGGRGSEFDIGGGGGGGGGGGVGGGAGRGGSGGGASIGILLTGTGNATITNCVVETGDGGTGGDGGQGGSGGNGASGGLGAITVGGSGGTGGRGGNGGTGGAGGAGGGGP